MIGSLFRRRTPRTAAQWFAARLGSTDPKLDRQFHAWLLEDSAHGEEYALCEIAWEVSHDAAHDASKDEPEPIRTRPADRTGLARRAAAFAFATAAAALVVWLWPPSTLAYSTAPGEQRTLVLQDGSRVTLNTRTRITVRLARGTRDVVLQQGEAFFEIAKDPSRPFTVHTSLGFARAVGTRFDVYLGKDRLSVTTEQGIVLVGGPRSGDGVLVDAGRHAELRAGMSRATVESADLNAVLGWLTRRLEVDDAPLGDVLREFSRYTNLPLRADTPAIDALRVSAVLHPGDLEALQATLQGAFGLQIERRGGELVVIDPKTPGPRSP
jgi:transmembrane sensor